MDDGGGLAGVVKEGSKPNQTKPNISYHGSGHHHLAIVLAVSIAHVLCAQSKIHSYFFSLIPCRLQVKSVRNLWDIPLEMWGDLLSSS